jgi:nicotinate-nucleotide adenylyltransferase
MSVLLFGGAFNPPHNEHLHILQAAIAALNPQKIFVLPSYISPHKQGNLMATAEQRLAMCRSAFGNFANVEVSDYEIQQGGVSYSYLTCEHFSQLYPHEPLYFLMGADMLAYFPKWKNPQKIISVCQIVACAREDNSFFQEAVKQFTELYHQTPITLSYVGEAVSSTHVRVLAALGEDIAPYDPKDVADVMANLGIYAQPALQKVKGFLKPDRWQHTVRVCYAAVRNCKQAGVDELTALTAAALHDVAKYLPLDSPYLKGFEPPADVPADVPAPVLHQFTGAYVAEHTFGITDQDILNAIRYHSSGRVGMSPLEKLIYLADLVEDGRDFEGVEGLRSLFYANLDQCFLQALAHQVAYLNSSDQPVYGLTQTTYEYYKSFNKQPK